MEMSYKLIVDTLLPMDVGNYYMGGTLVFILLLSSFFFLRLHLSTRKHPKSCLPPGPTPWPIVGSMLTMLRHKPYFRWVVSNTEGKDLARVRVGSTNLIIVNSPHFACEFLKKHDASFASRPFTMASDYAGRNFISVVVAPAGDQWKKMRRIIASEILAPAKLQREETLRLEEANHLLHYIYSECKKQAPVTSTVIDVRLALRYYCGNVIRRMVFGQRFLGEDGRRGMPGKEEVEYIDSAFTILSLIFALNMSDFMPSLRWLDIDGHERIVKKNLKVIDSYHDPIIDERIKKWRGEGASCKSNKVEDGLDSFISLKDSDGNPLLTTDEIKAQVAELIYATIDNPSNIVEWAITHLLDSPDCMRKAVEELDRVVGKNRLVQESDFSQLPYVKACARETLRLHPVAAFNLPHMAIDDTEVDGYFIPKGSWVFVSRVGLGRNPKVWPDPLRFDPERHLKPGANVELIERELRFLSFSTGRRGCMGFQLGSLMTFMMLARLLHAFEWSLAPGETCVDFSEERESCFKGRPLHACATPRLPWLLEQI